MIIGPAPGRKHKIEREKGMIRKEEDQREETNPRSSTKYNVCSTDVHRQLHSPEHAAGPTVTNSTPAHVHP